MSEEKNNKYYLWLDMEMTGLDEQVDTILEVACVVTDIQLNEVAHGNWIVYQPQSVLENMNDWCKKTHKENGLVNEVPNGLPLQDVEKNILTLLEPYFKKEDRPVLAGNSINNDKRFIDKYMPTLSKKLHYRLIDVSSFKEIFRDRHGIKVEKADSHRAKNDIYESIAELKKYLSFIKV